MWDGRIRGRLDTYTVTTWQSKINPPGKAEFGLLAALLLLAGGVAGAVWMVIQNAQSVRPVAAHQADQPDEEASESKSSILGLRRTKPETRKPTVAIVADPKAQAAIVALRTTIHDDGKPRKAAKPSEPKVAPNPAAQLDVDGQVVAWDAPEVHMAIKMLDTYRAAKSWREKLPLIHQSGQAQPLMEEYYGSQGLSDPDLAGLVSASNLKIGNRTVLALSYSSSERLNKIVHANFWRGADGLRLDWESLVGFSGRGMGSFRASHCTRPTVFRVLAVTDDYFNFEFTDAKKYLSLRLYNPTGEDYLHGYCLRDSADGRKLVEILGNSFDPTSALASRNGLRPQTTGHFPITVELAFPEDAQSDRCVKIEKFVSPWWLALDVEKQATAALERENSGDATVH